ncbi:DnaA regulatory inactivator Hda [Aquincola sp. S2]|uniref:DnaA regulatory inactivator Hda n=1 Tax=Pseudaquabacterium terrae TaxID=2732868 RepID=A0ABX2EGY7_9BURK|nr:DnaA regulatory inactivator Hda [Aquabacterium terrae]NRF67893.1 DnaA regulatory inactivator Hda [Aquabacterium terrae]
MKQIPLALVPPPSGGFESLLQGPNAAAVQHLRSLVMPAAPIYLWGDSGTGKTRLLRALAAERQREGERIGWFDAQDPLPWTLDEGWSLVVVDGCEALDAERQQAAFALFVEAGSHGVQWAAAGRLPPIDLPLRDDLRTRLGWGHVFALQALAEGETRAALRREADRRGILLSDDVMDYLLTRFQRDLKHLMQLLDRLDEFALAEHRAITVPLLKKMLAEQA